MIYCTIYYVFCILYNIYIIRYILLKYPTSAPSKILLCYKIICYTTIPYNVYCYTNHYNTTITRLITYHLTY